VAHKADHSVSGLKLYKRVNVTIVVQPAIDSCYHSTVRMVRVWHPVYILVPVEVVSCHADRQLTWRMRLKEEISTLHHTNNTSDIMMHPLFTHVTCL